MLVLDVNKGEYSVTKVFSRFGSYENNNYLLAIGWRQWGVRVQKAQSN